MKYTEGLFLGYRHFDKSTVKPMFPFGFGLSYTTFQYGGLQIAPPSSDGTVAVSFQVTNTGSREGAEVAEVYVGEKDPKVPRPVKELKGFARVDLKPGESRPVNITLDRRAFQYYDVTGKKWTMDPGAFAVLVGSSSEKVELQGSVDLKIMAKIFQSFLRTTASFLCLAGRSVSPERSAPPSPLHTRDLLWQKMTGEVARMEKTFDGVMGVVIRDLTDGREFAVNADDIFPTASTIKLPMLAELYRQSQTGIRRQAHRPIHFSQRGPGRRQPAIMQNLTPGVTRMTNHDLAGFVVAVSDNAATNVLIDRVGMDNVNRMLDSLGLHQTRLRRKMIDLEAARKGNENVSTPRGDGHPARRHLPQQSAESSYHRQFFDLMCTKKDSPHPAPAA